MVQQPARRPDNQMPAAFQLAQLLFHILAAIYGQNFHSGMARQLAGLLGNLQSQLAGRCHDKRLRIRLLHTDLVHNRQQKGQCFACSRLGPCDNIQSLHQRRNSFLLHRCRLSNPLTLKKAAQ
ncbi:hypothetical protein D3C86_1773700 [compost metagenome]